MAIDQKHNLITELIHPQTSCGGWTEHIQSYVGFDSLACKFIIIKS